MYFWGNGFIIVAAHISAALFFPKIGKLGAAFLFISSLLWISFLVFIRPAVIKFSNDTVLFISILIIFFMLTGVITLTPQQDSISIFRKLLRNQYPTKKDIYFGLLNFGIKNEKLLNEIKQEELSK
ncbi:MAG: hypothetical protein GX447_03010 [Elusimicrobia bacterium]|nr:hypothetical protein [Elusimicrobiota bacterium]